MIQDLKSNRSSYVVNGVVKHTFTPNESRQIESDVFAALCEAIDSPRSLACWLLYKHSEYSQLVQLELDPNTFYGTPDQFRGDLLVTKFLSKHKDLPINVDRESAAFEKWLLAEKACQKTNDMFRKRWDGGPYWSGDVEQVYHLARRHAQRILGVSPPPDVLSHGSFGPGSDLDTRANNISRLFKYDSPGSCTPTLLQLVADFVEDDRRDEMVNSAELVDHSRLTFVPKTAVVDRAICVEPRWNIFYQLSVGRVIASRLARFGIDIASQQFVNRDLASRAQRDGLATIDLSSASDSMSTNLVIDMLPEDWTDVLLRLRCPNTMYRGQKIRLEKISSMGNGYTFPLETLIFYCFGLAVCEHLGLDKEELSVFGDDIIIDNRGYPLLKELLIATGFTLNEKKSFVTGKFFESCGLDFYEGWNVRPFFLKESITNVERAIRLANQVTRFARCWSSAGDFDSRFRAARAAVISRIPNSLRLFGPDSLGDSVITAPFDEACPTPTNRKVGWCGYYVKAFVPRARHYDAPGNEALLFSKLDGPDAPGNVITKRSVVYLTIRRVYVLRYEGYRYSDE